MISVLTVQNPSHCKIHPSQAMFSSPSEAISSVGILLLVLLGSLLTTGCVSLPDPETSQIHEQEVIATLQAGGPAIGQTFISRRAGLESLTIWLGSEEANAHGSLQIELFHSPTDPISLYQSTLSTGGISAKKPVRITFPARDDPPGQTYYLSLHAQGKSLQIFGRSEDIYPQGAFFVAEVPVEADLAFRTTYNYGWRALLEDLGLWARAAWLVIPIGLLLLVPGWLLLDLSGLLHDFDLGEKVALAVGTSLAVIPVIMLWTTIFKLPWTASAVWFGFGFLTAILLVRLWKAFHQRKELPPSPPIIDPSHRAGWQKSGTLNILALLGIFIISLAVRLVMVRDFATPTWVDSVHHGLIARLILEQGSFPASYTPYLNIQPTEYHPGFHSLLAAFVWLSGLEIDRAMLVLGQVLNALGVFSSYLFATSLLKDRRAGLIAVAISSFFTPMPAYYASWGRYTHLAGMLILPVFLVLLKNYLHQNSPSHDFPPQEASKREIRYKVFKSGVLLCVVAGGLFLVHYRIAAFGILLVLAYLVFQVPLNLRSWGGKFGQTCLAALGAFLLTLPWFWPMLNQTLLPRLAAPGTPQPFFSGFTWQYLTAGLGTHTLVLAAFGLVLGASLRKRFAFTLLFWTLLLFLLPNLSVLGLPGGNFVNHTAVEISLYLPISLLGGYFLSQAIRALEKLLPKGWWQYLGWVLTLLAIILIFFGAKRIITILNPVTVLSRQPDLPALAWIEANIPANETIAINPFLWGYGIYAGSDGGYWIAPLTGHPTLPPPVLYGVSSPEEVSRITQTCEQIVKKGKDASELREIFRQNGIRYVYLGARGGVISPQSLEGSEKFQILYKDGGSWLFEVLP